MITSKRTITFGLFAVLYSSVPMFAACNHYVNKLTKNVSLLCMSEEKDEADLDVDFGMGGHLYLRSGWSLVTTKKNPADKDGMFTSAYAYVGYRFDDDNQPSYEQWDTYQYRPAVAVSSAFIKRLKAGAKIVVVQFSLESDSKHDGGIRTRTFDLSNITAADLGKIQDDPPQLINGQ